MSKKASSNSLSSAVSAISTAGSSVSGRPPISRSSNSSRSSTNSINERSNEVPPNTSNAAPTLTSTTTNNSSSNTSDASNPLESNASVIPIQASSNSNDTNYNSSTKSENVYQRIKKRPITGVLSNDADAELTCPICFDIIDVAHVTKCGHSFCQVCIQTALEHTHRCPKCNTPCTINKDVFPNFTLNQIIERYKEVSHTKKFKVSQATSNTILEFINSAQGELNIEDVNNIIELLAQKKEELKFTNKKVNELLLFDFLKHLQQSKTEELNKIQYELQMVNEDCKQVEECLSTLKTKPDQLLKLDNKSNDQQQLTSITSPTKSTEINPIENIQSPQSPNNRIQTILNNKKRIINRYFDELSQTYVQSHNKDLTDFNLKGTQPVVLDHIRSTVNKITNYTELRSIASVNYNSDLHSVSSIVSSVDFDKSYEHFAMAGVTKRIKIFDFVNIIDRPYGVHYPQYEMVHNAKLSCVSWNRYFRQQLACSDYDGVVTLWDAEAGSLIRSYQEHEKRCWGVQFCDVDPRLLASGSDDSKVKIWSTNSDYSLLSIDAKSNVCCVVFKPDSKFHVLFGTADHNIHYYDIRNAKEPVSLFRGHKKAVSYVKFSNENEFVSASTDSTLKLWKLNEGQCIRSFTGHVNEKNFVGLETHNGYIVTGSENNTVHLYCNELSKPLLTYKFDENGNGKKDEGLNDFVSAVCWSNQNYLLAANSQGVVKVLELI
ncbi:unnamed protein product [Brachionus calyciflorus]|uniref:RING-type domain-containing protein n=1 Tax=Brachionus calyciflorus TaxID=104777 RepID=A0A814DAK4_9BILA|nr:unnamed protein product [Brachionus calyciflorus]